MRRPIVDDRANREQRLDYPVTRARNQILGNHELRILVATQRPHRRPVKYLPIRVKSRPMTWAIPRLLSCVPSDDTAEVCANCRAFVELAGLITTNRDFRRASMDNGTHSRLGLFDLPHVAGR